MGDGEATNTNERAGEVLKAVLESPRLPSLPGVAVAIIELVQRPNVSIDEIAGIISRDPALTTKVLKTANSSFYGRARKVTRVRDAIMVMGLRTVKSLALSFSLVGDLGKGQRGVIDRNAFWERSLIAASGAQSVARSAKVPDAEDAFLGGLLHTIGVLGLLETLGEEYAELLAKAEVTHRRLLAMEQQRLGTDHAEVGAAMLENWNLPPLLSAAVRNQRTADLSPTEFRPVVRCVATGISIAEIAMGSASGEALAEYHVRCKNWFEMEPEQANELLEDVLRGADEMRSLFEVRSSGQWDADEVLARANEALVQLNLEVALENQQLQLVNQGLAAAASTDSLTGVANRRFFDQFLEAQFQIAKRYRTPLSLLMLDIDHFKRVNDQYGHQAGDEVLEKVAQAVAEHLRKADVLARYGGEEFAVVLPATDITGAAEVAERVRELVSETRVPLANGARVGVTVSVGIAEVEPSHEQAADLISSADHALFQAKATGRNRTFVAWSQQQAA